MRTLLLLLCLLTLASCATVETALRKARKNPATVPYGIKIAKNDQKKFQPVPRGRKRYY